MPGKAPGGTKLEIQKARMIDGCKIAYNYLYESDKPPLVLSTSIGADMSMWEEQIASLAEQFSLLLYDMRGHGRSDTTPGHYSLDRLHDDVINLLDILELDQVNYCGLSLGGMIGQVLAVKSPHRLDRLVLANTSPYAGEAKVWQERIDMVTNEGLGKLWESLPGRWFSAEFINNHPDRVETMKQMFLKNDPAGYIGCCAAIRDMDLRNLAGLNNTPSLIITGENDIATPPDDSDFLFKKAKQARLITLKAGHMSNIEQPESFSRATIDFITCSSSG